MVALTQYDPYTYARVIWTETDTHRETTILRDAEGRWLATSQGQEPGATVPSGSLKSQPYQHLHPCFVASKSVRQKAWVAGPANLLHSMSVEPCQ